MRLFVAITLDDHVRSTLEKIQGDFKRRLSGVRWVAPHQVHMTVKFLGEVPDSQAVEVSKAVERAASRSVPFDFELSSCGCFPPRGGVRVIWVGGGDAPEALGHCVEAVEDELASLGFARERRPFSPHLTLGRVREDRSGDTIRSTVCGLAFGPVSQSVDSLTVMSSALSPKGPTYSVVSQADLVGV